MTARGWAHSETAYSRTRLAVHPESPVQLHVVVRSFNERFGMSLVTSSANGCLRNHAVNALGAVDHLRDAIEHATLIYARRTPCGLFAA
jgi:hypothetical protein